MTGDKYTQSEDAFDDLDDLFNEARDLGRASTSEALIDRITQDAVLARRAPALAPAPLWARFEAAIGGWPSLGGLITATAAGFYIGFADPTVLETVGLSQSTELASDLLLADETLFDTLLFEEG